jgi:hypothetical protein
MTTPPKWQDFYAAHFHRLSDAEVNTWEWEMREGPRKIRNFSQELLMNAIRRLAGNKDRDGKVIPAKLKDVQDEMFAIMREFRKADDQAIRDNLICSECNNTGFYVGFRMLFDAKERKIVVGVCSQVGCGTDKCHNHTHPTICYDLAIPCRCKIGDDMMRVKPGYQDHKAIAKLQDMILAHKRNVAQEVTPAPAAIPVTLAQVTETVKDGWEMPF